jgi:O-antigen/teichoic acid export membrane protein
MQDSLWTLYTDAYQNKDFKWIKKTLIRLNKLFLIFVLVVVVFAFISKPIIKLWIQRDLLISDNLIIFMSIYVLVRVYGLIYMNFLNAIGKIKLQMKLYILGALLNIPLSIYFVKYLNLGNSGVILGTVFSIICLTIILPFQTFKILKSNNTIC